MSVAMLVPVALFANIFAGSAPDAPRVPPPLETPQPASPVAAPLPPLPPPEVETHWYGWQLMLADTASLVVAANSQIPTAGHVVGFGSLVLTAPILHLLNHNTTGAIASLAVRGGVTLLAAMIIGGEPEPCPQGDSYCPLERAPGTFADAFLAAGLLLGGVIFAVVDDTVLAKVSVPRTSPKPSRASSGSRSFAALSPFVAPRTGGLSFGLGGAF